MIMALIGYSTIMVIVVSASMYIIRRFDSQEWYIVQREWCRVLVCCVFNSLLIFRLLGNAFMSGGLLSVFGGTLIFACVTDIQCCEVFRFIWWVALGAAGLLLVWGHVAQWNGKGEMQLWGVLCYILLQELFFCRMYGRADCHAFGVCALVYCAFGGGFRECLIQMLLAFGALALVQLFRRNINRSGNLKHPVAFLPYITFAVWVNLMLIFSRKNAILMQIHEIFGG